MQCLPYSIGKQRSSPAWLRRLLRGEIPFDHPLVADRSIDHVGARGGPVAEQGVLDGLTASPHRGEEVLDVHVPGVAAVRLPALLARGDLTWPGLRRLDRLDLRIVVVRLLQGLGPGVDDPAVVFPGRLRAE